MSNDTDLTLDQITSEISDILARRTGAKMEGRILAILRSLNAEHLAGTLDRIDLRRLLRALDDRRWGPDSRKEFLRILPSAIEYLEVESKSALITGLARKNCNLPEEKTIEALFLSERGERLTTLKLGVDRAKDGHDLLHILYNDISSAEIRHDLIRHFQRAPEPQFNKLRVVSDIDDTLYSSLHDSRYSKGTIYPGVMELLSQLSPIPPVFLTARPELSASLFERITHRQLARYGLEGCTVLSGNIPGLFGYRRMAEQKARTLTQYRELYPELRFLFIGDSGQGDMDFSRTLLGRKPSPIERALIHKLGDHQPGSKSDHPAIQTFEHYGEAAHILGQHGYLNEDQVSLVLQALD